MKSSLMALALSGLTAIPASAMLSDDAAQVKIQRYASDVDVTQLTQGQIATLLHVINSGEGRSDTQSLIASLLRKYQ